jgi:hypothetical protein
VRRGATLASVTTAAWLLLAAPLLLAAGKPLHYWGARAPVLVSEPQAETDAAPTANLPTEALVRELHTAVVDGDLLLRLTFDRPIQDALYLPGGAPVSGRLRLALYFDTDNRVATGLVAGPQDARNGAERRLEVSVVALGEDPEEKRAATALVLATLTAVSGRFFQDVLWRADDDSAPDAVAWRGEWLELRVPGAALALGPQTRLVLSQGGRASVGRVAP